MSNNTFHGRMLCRAAEKLRGVPQLAAALSVPESTLRRWMSGESNPPEAVFRASMEIFLDARRPPRYKARPRRAASPDVA